MKISWLCGLILGVSLMALPAFGHHSFAAEYDGSKAMTLTGTVTKVEWMNPHARFYVDVKDDSGKTTSWELELGSPNGLIRKGWTRNSMKPGDVVTVEASPAKDGSKLANTKTVRLADGRELFGGSASETGNPKAGQ